MNRAAFFLLLLVVITTIIACNTNPYPETDNPLVGYWSDDSYPVTYIFRPGMTFTEDWDGDISLGTYAYTDVQLVFKYDDAPASPVYLDYWFEDSKLVFTDGVIVVELSKILKM